jgi:glycosyltransferase involved in cell wall biosynthesis
MNVGGPAVLLAELVGGLPKAEFEHTLITGRCESNEVDYLDSHQLDSDVIYLNKVQRSLLPLSDIRSFFELVNLIRKLKPDVIHTHTSKAGALGRIAGKLAAPRAKIIHTFHGHLLYGYFSPFKTKLITSLEKLLAFITDELVAVTQQVKNDLLQAGIGHGNNWHVIRPGLAIPAHLSKVESRNKLGIRVNTFSIAWVGRFTDIKDPLLAIRSLEKLLPEHLSKVQLTMAGDGELLQSCRDYVDKRNLPVEFVGWCNDISPLLYASDLLLISSKNEGMPVVIVEAALRGVPTLSTSVGGVGEFIKNGVSGYLAQNSDELGASLQRVITNEMQRMTIAKNAIVLSRAEFSRELFIAKHMELYRAKKA